MQIKALGKQYTTRFLEDERPQTLGEQRRLYREYGWAPGSGDLDLANPDHVAAVLYLAFQEANPDAPHKMLLVMVDRVREIEFVNDDGTPFTGEETPTDPAVSEQPGPTPPAAESETTGG